MQILCIHYPISVLKSQPAPLPLVPEVSEPCYYVWLADSLAPRPLAIAFGALSKFFGRLPEKERARWAAGQGPGRGIPNVVAHELLLPPTGFSKTTALPLVIWIWRL